MRGRRHTIRSPRPAYGGPGPGGHAWEPLLSGGHEGAGAKLPKFLKEGAAERVFGPELWQVVGQETLDALLYFSTRYSRARPIFVLNVFTILLALAVGGLIDYQTVCLVFITVARR